jgi:para-nitrobenzyl esterase
MKQIYLLFSCLMTTVAMYAQSPCATGRYASNVYSAVTTTSNITYGQNTSWSGASTTLKLDFYEPQGDTATARPLIIWVHGGSFIGGSKTDIDVLTWSQEFAKKGYVCASIDYRLGFFPIDSANAVKAVVRAVQDLKGALRFFYKDRQTTNTYKIDTNHVYIGGSSAGAITALHVAYLNDPCEISDYLNASTISSLGGLEGTSGNPGYSTTVHGVLNGCGALARYSWLETGNVPLCSVHGTNDGTVKYNRGIVNPGTPLMYLDGSRMLHERACALGVENKFYTFPNAPHVPYAGNAQYMDTTLNFFRDFLLDRLGCTDPELQPENAWMESATLYAINYCDGSPVNEVCASSNISEKQRINLNVYPNPTRTEVTISWGSVEKITIQILDVYGRQIIKNQVIDKEVKISCLGLKSGNYFVHLHDSKGNIIVKKLVVE